MLLALIYVAETLNGEEIVIVLTIDGGSVTAISASLGAGIGGGYDGRALSTVITGGSVMASSIGGTPTNGSSTPASVYLTTVTLPAGSNINSLAIQQSGTAYSYG